MVPPLLLDSGRHRTAPRVRSRGGAVLPGTPYRLYTDPQQRGNDNADLWAAVTVLGLLVGGFLGFVVVIIYVLVGRE